MKIIVDAFGGDNAPPFGAMHLVVHRDDAIQLITQKQRTARTVIQPLNPP